MRTVNRTGLLVFQGGAPALVAWQAPGRYLEPRVSDSFAEGTAGRNEVGAARLNSVLSAAILAAPAIASSPPPAWDGWELPPFVCPATPGRAVLDLVNAERARHSLPPLAPDTVLVRAARIHADDMARGDFVNHQGSDGSYAAERVEGVGYPWIWVGENIAAGQETPLEVVAGWIRSDGHRAVIHSPHAMSAGVALARSSAGAYGTYWVMVYAATDLPSPGVVECHP